MNRMLMCAALTCGAALAASAEECVESNFAQAKAALVAQVESANGSPLPADSQGFFQMRLKETNEMVEKAATCEALGAAEKNLANLRAAIAQAVRAGGSARHEQHARESFQRLSENVDGFEDPTRGYAQAGKYADLYENVANAVAEKSNRRGEVRVDPRVLKAVMLAVTARESSFNTNAVSQSYVKGLMQVKATTAQEVGVNGDQRIPKNSVLAGARVLVNLWTQFGHGAALEMGSDFKWVLRRVLGAYSSGPNDAHWATASSRYISDIMRFLGLSSPSSTIRA